MKIRKSKMKKFVLETIDFTSIFKGYRIPIPFFLLCIDIYNHKKLPNYFSPKWANHSIYNGLMVVLIVRNMERNKCSICLDLEPHSEPLIFLVFKGVSEQIEIFLI